VAAKLAYPIWNDVAGITDRNPYFWSGIRNNQPEMMLTQMTVVWVMKGKRIYRIEYTAEARAYAKFMPQFQAMLDSFELS
jgi:hypothetical protein